MSQKASKESLLTSLESALNNFNLSGVKNVFKEDYIGTTRHYTFKLNLTIGTDGSQDQLFLVLFPKHVYTIFIFDPEYYLYSTNPVALPTIMTQFDTRTTLSQYYRLDMTEVNELNLPEDPCDAEADTNFHSCIRRSVSDQVRDAFKNVLAHFACKSAKKRLFLAKKR